MFSAAGSSRIQNPERIDTAEITTAIAAKQQIVVQFSEHDDARPLLADLDALAATCGAALQIRFYGNHFTPFDATILRALPHAVNLSLDCHRHATHLETLGELTQLKHLALGAFELAQSDVLALPNLRQLESLTLGPTRKGNIDLAPLRNWPQLKSFHTSGHVRNIDAITALPALTQLSLSQIKSRDSVDFINCMPALTSLRFLLGGRTSIAGVSAPLLEHLEVERVRGLADLGDIGRFARLRSLLVADQIRLERLALGPNPALASIIVRSCKALTGLDGLGELAALRNLALCMSRIDAAQMLSQRLPPSLVQLSILTGKRKEDQDIGAELTRRGYRAADTWIGSC